MSCNWCSRKYTEEVYCDQCENEHKLCFICYENLMWDDEINRVIWCYDRARDDKRKFEGEIISCYNCSREIKYDWGVDCHRCGYCDEFTCTRCSEIYHFKGKCILQGGKATKIAKEN